MDPLRNPFSPGAGSPPPELAGRGSILEQARILLGRIKSKKSEKSLLLTGLRGVGKTVLLNEIRHYAEKESYRTVLIEAHEEKSLTELLIPYLRRLLGDLVKIERYGTKLKRAIAVFLGFVKSLKLQAGELTFAIDIKPESGTADSGDLEVDLPELMFVLAEAAEEQRTSIALFLDEMQFFDRKELSALIMAMHRVQQRQLPFVLLGAGLPILPGLAGESKSYAERLFSFPEVGALSESDSAKALREPVRSEGITFETAAVEEIFRLTKGYPYYLQEWGYHSWNRAERSPITVEVVRDASTESIDRLDNGFFRVRFDRCTPGEKQFLLTIAKLGDGPQKTSDIAEARKVKISSIGPVRAKLIQKGMIYSPSHGEIDFTVPLFGDFLIRTMKP